MKKVMYVINDSNGSYLNSFKSYSKALECAKEIERRYKWQVTIIVKEIDE